MIYFVEDERDGWIKIGTTTDLPKRLAALGCEHKTRLRVLAVMDGGRPEEKAIHARFSHLRTTGEWFVPSGELAEFMRAAGREWVRVDDGTVKLKIARPLASKVKAIANHRGTGSAEVLSELSQAVIDRAYAQMLRELEGK